MSDPKDIKAPKDELASRQHRVQDLEPDEKNAEDVRGGFGGTTALSCKCAERAEPIKRARAGVADDLVTRRA